MKKETMQPVIRVAIIYGLCDIDGQIRYVGKSIEPKRRLYVHTSVHNHHRGIPVYDWIYSLAQAGRKPQMVILEEVDISEWEAAEKRWIEKLRESGARLLNVLDGGDTGPTLSGSQNGNSTLTEEKVAQIKQRLCDGDYLSSIAKDFGVGTSTIHRIKSDQIWTHVPWPRELVNRGYRNRPMLGSMHPNAKLTEANVVDIKARLRAGEAHALIAASYNVTPATISSIAAGKTWRSV